jgi:predicted flap endonuclease-1-like 5' DNA nuclease
MKCQSIDELSQSKYGERIIMPKLENVEGIGEVYGAKLREAGIRSINALLQKGSTPQGRQEIAEKSGISGKRILTWVNHADLKRIKGVERQYSELLEAAGVDTVVELAQRNPENLHKKMLETNEEKRLVRRPPALSMVTDWVEQAKKLPRGIHY